MLSLKAYLGDSIKENMSLKNSNWFKIGGIVKYFFTPKDLDQLKFFLQNKPSNLSFFILGAGSNILISDAMLDLCVIKLTNFNNISVENDELVAQAGVLNFELSNFGLNNNIANFEFLSGIPGSVGGGIAMNAGAFGSEFSDIVTRVLALDYNGNTCEFSKSEMGFAYRKNSLVVPMIFYQAYFKITYSEKDMIKQKLEYIKQNREETQPKKVLTGGSTFANPLPHKAWELIDKVGLRGYKIGGAMFSNKHCNFIINDGTASFSDIVNLIREAKNRVYDATGIQLQTEIKIIE